MRILVAEDDAILADGVTRTLRQSGYAVDWVKNGAEADSALDTEDFDLLILDLGLPKKSGLDVLKRLRLRGLDAGADDYLAKPFELAERGSVFTVIFPRLALEPLVRAA